jgi:hypothetical protein
MSELTQANGIALAETAIPSDCLPTSVSVKIDAGKRYRLGKVRDSQRDFTQGRTIRPERVINYALTDCRGFWQFWQWGTHPHLKRLGRCMEWNYHRPGFQLVEIISP